MVILGLDASTTACGWCILDGDQYVGSGVQVWTPKIAWECRVIEFAEWLNRSLEQHVIDVIGYEIASGGHKNKKTDRQLGAVEYVVRTAAIKHAARFLELSPSQVKATGCHKDALGIAASIIRQNDPGFEFVLKTAKDRDHAGDWADGIGAAYAALAKLTKEQLHDRYGDYNPTQ